MLEIKPIESKEEQEQICACCGINFRSELFAYKAYDNGKLLAASQFDIEGKSAVIYDMKQVIGSPDDFEAMFILGRAVLNFLDLCGVQTVYFDNKTGENEKIAKLIGFKNENERFCICLTGLFDATCHNKASTSTTDKS